MRDLLDEIAAGADEDEGDDDPDPEPAAPSAVVKEEVAAKPAPIEPEVIIPDEAQAGGAA